MNNTLPDQYRSVQSTTDPAAHVSAAHVSSKESIGKAVSLGIVGAIAAILSHVAIMKTGRVFELPADLMDIKISAGRNQSPEIMKQFYESLSALDYKHAALWIGTCGAISGVLFGLALGMMRQSRTSIVKGALGGLILGCLFSSCAGLAGNFVGENIVSKIRMEKIDVPAQYAMLLHGTIWLIVGLGIGLGTGFGTTKSWLGFALGSMFMGGIAAGAAGAFYPFLASVALPFADPSLTIPEGDVNRVIWLGLPLIVLGLTLGRRG